MRCVWWLWHALCIVNTLCMQSASVSVGDRACVFACVCACLLEFNGGIFSLSGFWASEMEKVQRSPENAAAPSKQVCVWPWSSFSSFFYHPLFSVTWLQIELCVLRGDTVRREYRKKNLQPGHRERSKDGNVRAKHGTCRIYPGVICMYECNHICGKKDARKIRKPLIRCSLRGCTVWH